MNRLRKLSAALAPDPTTGAVYAVRYVDHRGETVTRVYRERHSAECFAQQVTSQGGMPRTFRAKTVAWVET